MPPGTKGPKVDADPDSSPVATAFGTVTII
jgi:hypothetical protein